MQAINLTHNGQKYTVKCTVINTNSNYNKAVSVFKTGCNIPEFGTILKDTTTPKQLKQWAINTIEANKAPNNTILNAFTQ